MIDQNKLLDLLLYAVNEANGWHDDARGGNIQSPEMAQCVAVLAAHGRHSMDCEQFRSDDGGMFDRWSLGDFVQFLEGCQETLKAQKSALEQHDITASELLERRRRLLEDERNNGVDGLDNGLEPLFSKVRGMIDEVKNGQ